MGHEIGHYVLGHVWSTPTYFGILTAIGFALIAWAFERLRRRFGARWGVRDIGDVAGMPLALLIVGAYFFLITPITNTIVRVNELQADLFGLNASGEPDGEAEVVLKLGEYRKMDPGPLEEWIFYDHPSGRVRIENAMRWKIANEAVPLPAGGTSPPVVDPPAP